MKKITFVLFMLASVSAFAYQAGRASRPQFSTAPAKTTVENQEKPKEDNSSVPGQQSVQTRSFTSYSSRSGNAWRQGVQTKPVQTQTATAAAKPKNEQAVKDNMARINPSAVTAKPTEKAAKGANNASAKKAAPETAEEKPEGASKAGQRRYLGSITFKKEQAPAVAQMLQQMMGGAQGGNSGAQPNAAGSTPAMPAGMPDMSALMNMAGQGKKK